MLSDLVRRSVIDAAGRRGSVVDLAVDLGVTDCPLITRLVVRQGLTSYLVPADQIVELADPIRVADLEGTEQGSDEAIADDDLLRRDVLDMLVLDLDRGQAVRVNDIWLRPADEHDDTANSDRRGALVVGGVDVSPQAILRRITNGLVGGHEPGRLVKWTDLELLHGDPVRARRERGRQLRVTRLQAARIADLAEAIPYLHAAELLTLLEVSLAADVFELLAPERQLQVVGELDKEHLIAMLADVAPDHVADVLGQLPLDDAREILEKLPRAHALLVSELLRYPPGTAGGIMTNDVIVVPVELTVAEAIEAIRPRLATPDLVYYVYVVENLDARRLVGILTLRDLLLAHHGQSISKVMNAQLVCAEPLENAAVVAYRLADYQLNALPVVGAEQRLLGVVTIDKAIAQIAPETLRQDLPRVFA